MTVTLKVGHNLPVVAHFTKSIAKQMPFTMMTAINKTAEQVQGHERANIFRKFSINNQQFASKAIKLKPFAKKNRLWAKVAVDPPGGRVDVFGKFERAHTKRPRGKSIAIPDTVKRGARGAVPKSKRPKSFGFKRTGSGSGGTVYQGSKRTFMIQKADGTGGIYKRVGRKVRRRGRKRSGKAGTRMVSNVSTRQTRDMNVRTLYRFTPSASIDDRLRFSVIARGKVRVHFARNYDAALRRALRTARGGTGGASAQQRRIARADIFGSGRQS